jgi:outer membrane protein
MASLDASAAPALPVAGQAPPIYALNDCLQLALERNPAILKAQNDIERTQGLIITAKSTLYPQVSVNGRVEKRDDDLFSQGTDPTVQRFRDYWTIQLTVTQSLYSGGVNRQQIAIAKLEHEAALVQLRATIDLVLKGVKYAVYAIAINQAQIDAEQQTIKLLTEEESRQKALFDAGRTTRFNVLRTEVSLGNQRSLLYQAQNDLTSSQIALAQLLSIEWPHGLSPLNPPFHTQENLDCPRIGNIRVEDFIALALTRRPELQVLDRQIEIAERQIKIDKAATVPRIDAYATDEQARDQTLSSFNKSLNDYAVGLLGTWNVFDGFAGKGQVMTDTATLGTIHISRDETRLHVENEVREAYARLTTAQQTLDSQAANVKTAEESVKLAQLSAETGYATLLDVLQATLDLTAARTEALKTKGLYLEALADLEYAISLKFVDWPDNENDAKANPNPTPPAVPVPPAAPAQ